MSPKEIQKRNVKAENLRVLQSDNQFFVESEKGKVLYNVVLGDDGNKCTCGDFSTGIRRDKNHQCKHILAVMNAIPRKTVDDAQFLEKLVPKLDDRFLTNIKGKDFVLYAGVLDLATQKGLLKLEVELLQYPSKENEHEAICRAVAVGKDGSVFGDIGDANPKNTHSMIAKHLIRMASTRSKARALRDMCNIQYTTLEEIASPDDVIGSEQPKKTTQKKAIGKTDKKEPKPKTAAKKKAPAKASKDDKSASKTKTEQPKASEKVETTDESNNEQPKMSSAQKNAIYNLSRRRGISVQDLESMAMDAYGCELENLNSTDASQFIRQLQQAA
jgi:predicted nucleic acid-binding Zn finger protein